MYPDLHLNQGGQVAPFFLTSNLTTEQKTAFNITAELRTAPYLPKPFFLSISFCRFTTQIQVSQHIWKRTHKMKINTQKSTVSKMSLASCQNISLGHSCILQNILHCIQDARWVFSSSNKTKPDSLFQFCWLSVQWQLYCVSGQKWKKIPFCANPQWEWWTLMFSSIQNAKRSHKGNAYTHAKETEYHRM